jgi:protoporphyrinogen oxidase
MESVVVVGGGPSGLLAALMAAKRGRRVTVVEEEPECGGLLRSITNKDGVVFDYGNHMARQTGIPELDEILFADIHRDTAGWQRIPHLLNGTYFCGKLYNLNSWVNLNFLPRATYEKAILELLHLLPPPPEACANDEEYLLKAFGPTLVEHLFRPAMRKFCGMDLKELSPVAHRYFDLTRLIAFTPDISRELKKSPAFDGRLAFHLATEGQSGLLNYYPATGGIGQWIPLLLKRMSALGVEIRNGLRVETVDRKDGRIQSLRLSDGSSLACDTLVWSVTPAPLLKASGALLNGGRPRFRNTTLHFFVFDKPLKMECAAFTCFDPNYKIGRVTYYPNYRSNPADKKIFAACVEMISDAADTSEAARHEIVAELKQMGLLEESARATFEESRSAKAGFPIHTPDFARQTAGLDSMLRDSFQNLVPVGKGTGRTFFMTETLIDTYKTITASFP